MSHSRSVLAIGFSCALLLTTAACGSLLGGGGFSGSMGKDFDQFDFGSLTSPKDMARFLVVNVGDRVFFEKNSSRIKISARDIVEQQVKFLNKNPSATITIEGHCDERGTREYNLALGLRRATALRDAMVASGMDASRIQVASYGKERPVAGCSRERCWKVNRRSVVVINGAS